MRSARFRLIAMMTLISVSALLQVSSAQAATKWGCSVKYVKPWEYTYGGQHAFMLHINCASDGATYAAYTVNQPSCTNYTSLDLTKSYMTLAQSALLSGKAVDIDYSTACGVNMISGLALSGY